MYANSKFSVTFYLRKNKTNQSGLCSVMIRIYVSRTDSKSFSSHIEVEADKWDTTHHKVLGNTLHVRQINDRLESMRVAIKKHYRMLTEENPEEYISAEDVKDAYLGVHTKKRKYFLETYQTIVDYQQSRLEIGEIKEKTYNRYQKAYGRISVHIKDRYKKQDVPLRLIDKDFIMQAEIYLKKEGLGHNAAMKELEYIKKVINYAYDNNLIKINPFKSYQIKKKETKRQFLTQAELLKIITKKFDNERLERVRDCFIFCCFTGIVDKKRRKEKEGNVLVVRN